MPHRRRDEDGGRDERAERGKECRCPEADDLGQQPGGERGCELGADRPNLDRRRHAAKRAVVDPSLTN